MDNQIIHQPEVVKEVGAKDKPIQVVVDELVSEFEKVPYKYGNDGTIRLSKSEKFLVDIFLRTLDYKVTAKVLSRIMRQDYTPVKVRYWLTHRMGVKSYLESEYNRRAKINGETFEAWLAGAIDFRDGKKASDQTTYRWHRLIGEVKGFIKDNRPTGNSNLHIEFTQNNGNV